MNQYTSGTLQETREREGRGKKRRRGKTFCGLLLLSVLLLLLLVSKSFFVFVVIVSDYGAGMYCSPVHMIALFCFDNKGCPVPNESKLPLDKALQDNFQVHYVSQYIEIVLSLSHYPCPLSFYCN